MQTTKEQRAVLAKYGLVRVDGLMTHMYGAREPYTITAEPQWLGRWGYNNGKAVIVTIGGEMWLTASDLITTTSLTGELAELRDELCPYGQGAFVPCSNGEQVHMLYLLKRFANPDWQWPSEWKRP